ncbi:UDP-N-acetylglucosamine 1-carboxyvinyltransferase [Candidatus Woesearchaeota archaeon]|nr:UDP-N-acetylglucosamine 1-carboxyvinyltransferase [Candidatus Woesearchaeota archaeon]
MNKIIINGNNKLKGIVNISGSKNESLAILCASILSSGRVILRNVPNIKDVSVMKKLIKKIGSKIKTSNNKIIIEPKIKNHLIKSNNAGLVRNSILLLGPLIAKRKKATIPLPGGCNIGSRPINLHLDGLRKLGVDIRIKNNLVYAEAKELKGANIILEFPSVGATQNILITATLAKGKTIINNAAKEPEVQGLAKFLNQMGASIKGIGTSTITINGVEELTGTEYSMNPDRIETITYLILGSFSGNNIRIKNVTKKDVSCVIKALKTIGAKIEQKKDELIVKGNKDLKSINIIAKPHPDFPTDAQPLISSLLSYAKGISKVTDTVFAERFSHVKELKKMGVNIQLKNKSIEIKGQNQLSGNLVSSQDIRGGMALILAGLSAKGQTIIKNTQYIDRGYEDYIKKLQLLGADIKKIN